jgi:hypothetical protein
MPPNQPQAPSPLNTAVPNFLPGKYRIPPDFKLWPDAFFPDLKTGTLPTTPPIPPTVATGDVITAVHENTVSTAINDLWINEQWLASNSMTDPTAAKGDIPVRGASGLGALAVGSNGQILTADSTQPLGVKWITPAPGGVTSFNGRVGAVMPASGDYTAAQVTGAVNSGSTYADPAWITSLAWSKITGAPAGAAPGAPTGSVQFNNAGSFAGSANLVWNGSALGIGTSTPDSTGVLHIVNASSLARVFVDGYASGGANLIGRVGQGTAASPLPATAGQLMIYLTGRGWCGGSTGWSNSAYIGLFAAENFTPTSAASYIGFATCPSGAVGMTERMRIDQNGNVGIGGTPAASQTSPSASVTYVSVVGRSDVGSVEVVGTLADALNNIVGQFAFADLNNTTSNKRTAVINAYSTGTTVGSRGGSMTFSTRPDNINGLTERMRIDHNGLVGIGKTPAYALDVQGDLNITGTYRVNGTPISTGGTGSPPGGTNGMVQYNNAGAFGGSANLFWDATNNRLGVGTSTPGAILHTKAAAELLRLETTGTVASAGLGYMTFYDASGSRQGFIGFGGVANQMQLYLDGSGKTFSILNCLVGIAKTAAYALDVNGDCNITGTYRVNGVAIGTGGGGTPASPTGSVQFNNAGAFGGSANLTWDNVNGRLGIGTSSPQDVLHVHVASNQNFWFRNMANAFGIIGYSGFDSLDDSFTRIGLIMAGNPLKLYANLVRIGTDTTAPWGELQVVSTNTTSSTRGISTCEYADAVLGANFIVYKSRGTVAAPTAVLNGDYIGQLGFLANDGSGTVRSAAAIQALITGAVGTNIVPTALIFGTAPAAGGAATERMRIDQLGNVGIGTTAPLWSATPTTGQIFLSVKGASDIGGVEIAGTVADTQNNVVGGLYFIDANSTNTNKRAGSVLGWMTGPTAGNRGGSLTFNTHADGATGGQTERMRIDHNGNVGIGTTSVTGSGIASPGTLLQVTSTGNLNTAISGVTGATSGSNNGVEFVAYSNVSTAGDPRIGEIAFCRLGDQTAGKLSSNFQLYINNDGALWSALYVQPIGGSNAQAAIMPPSGGTVYTGINTASPAVPLHVTGQVSNEIARFQGRTDVSNNRSYISLYTTNPGYHWEISNEDAAGGGTSNGLAFREIGGGAGSTSPGTLRVTFQGGNVGIGPSKSSPAYALDVAGDINITGSYRLNGTALSAGGISNSSNVMASRALGSNYQNTTGKPMFVQVNCWLNVSATMYIYTGATSGSLVVIGQASANASGAQYMQQCFWVLAGYWYSVATAGGSAGSSIEAWVESY